MIFDTKEIVIGGTEWKTAPFRFNRMFTLSGGSGGSYIDVLLSGVSPLVLTNAIELNYLKLFGGTEQRNLPSGYTQVEYLQSSGTQYIDTGVVLKSKATVTTVGQFLSITPSTSPISAWGFMGDGNLPRWGCSIYSGNWLMDLNATTSTAVANTNKHTFVNETDGTTTYNSFVDGVSIYGQALSLVNVATYQANTLTAYLFARNNSNTAGNFSSSRIYSFNIVQDDVLVINLIPCRRNSDNVLGMFDTVTGNFLTNAGTGTFTAGADVTPTPDTPMDIVCNNGVVKLSPNLFDKSTADANRVTAYFPNTGTQWAWAELGFSVRIPCKPNTTYTARYNGSETQAVLSFGSTDNDTLPTEQQNLVQVTQAIRQNNPTINTPITITTGANDKWIIVAYNIADPQHSDMANNLQVEQGSTATTYRPYGQIYTDGTTETVEVRGKNLFDKETLITGYIADNGDIMSSSVSAYSTAIPVIPNTTYVLSGATLYGGNSSLRIHGYSAQDVWVEMLKKVLTSTPTEITNPIVFTTGSTDYFVRISYVRDNMQGIQLELGSTATTYEPYTVLGTATAENLFKVGTYQDEQEVLTGDVTRTLGILVLNGTEEQLSYYGIYEGHNLFYYDINSTPVYKTIQEAPMCTHYTSYIGLAPDMPDFGIRYQAASGGTQQNWNRLYIGDDRFDSLDKLKTWLAEQYAKGDPVIIIYHRVEPTTETVTAQPLTTQAGTNIVEITQASIDDLTMEISYKQSI